MELNELKVTHGPLVFRVCDDKGIRVKIKKDLEVYIAVDASYPNILAQIETVCDGMTLHAKHAMSAQNACNLLAVLGSFRDCTQFLANTGFGTHARNESLFAVMFATQVAHLTKGGLTDTKRYSEAYGFCEALIKADKAS